MNRKVSLLHFIQLVATPLVERVGGGVVRILEDFFPMDNFTLHVGCTLQEKVAKNFLGSKCSISIKPYRSNSCRSFGRNADI